MATKLRWNDYYQPMTPIGQGFQTIAAGLFNGPGAGELAAGQAEAEFKRAQMAKAQAETQLLQYKLRGQDQLGNTMADAARFAPDLNARPLTGTGTLSEDPNAPVVSFDRPAAQATAQDFFGRMPIDLAQQALRGGIDIKQAADANVLAKSSDYFGDRDRANAYVGTGKVIRPFDAFSEQGQLGAERRETGQKAAVAATSERNKPLTLDQVRGQQAQRLLAGQPVSHPNVQILGGVRDKPSSEVQNRRDIAHSTGLSEAEQIRLTGNEKILETAMKNPNVSPDRAIAETERMYPGIVEETRQLRAKSAVVSRPAVPANRTTGAPAQPAVTARDPGPSVFGQQQEPLTGKWYVSIQGKQVEARKAPDGQWYVNVNGQNYQLTPDLK